MFLGLCHNHCPSLSLSLYTHTNTHSFPSPQAGILYNLKRRHVLGKPYTRAGDIVIAVNPFQWFTNLYTEQKRVHYSNKLVWEEWSEHDPRDGLEPHIYEVSSLAYRGLAYGGGDQSILVSGESGAGKTETVKIAMNHMAGVQGGYQKLDTSSSSFKGMDNNKKVTSSQRQALDPVVQRVVESNPLLEAFGNASTRRNDNSSRFGKYLHLQFDNKNPPPSQQQQQGEQQPQQRIHMDDVDCKLAGSKCEVYLLEKNRVTVHDEDERTYHIFYQLIAAPDQIKTKFWKNLKGTDCDSFKYIGPSAIKKVEGKADHEHFDHTIKTLALVGVEGNKLITLMRAICIVLQSGNLVFGAKDDVIEKSEIKSDASVSADLADLMGVKTQDLSLAFTERTMRTKTESFKVPLSQSSAREACDAFAKEVYGKVFLWVVNAINEATRAEDNYKGGGKSNFGIVGLLDIFGFESFVRNRFEQLCINYANEKLQQKFTEDVFRTVQQEYEREGIALVEIQFDDNTDVLQLIEGRSGLLAMLNEECVRPGGSDAGFVQKALSQNKTSPCLLVNKTNRMSFGVHHYAGKVHYDATGFIQSNQDTLPTDLEDLMHKSNNDIVSKSIQAPHFNVGTTTDEATTTTTTTTIESSKPLAKRATSSSVANATVWGKYKSQLSSLMSSLRKTNSRYIRCIKPNMAKKPMLMEHMATLEQLRCAGVVAAVTLARSAFPNRLDNNGVRWRYLSMWDSETYPSKRSKFMNAEQASAADAMAVLSSALKSKEYIDQDGNIKEAFIVGKTKSFFRAGAMEYLDANRGTELDQGATIIQTLIRGVQARNEMAAQLEAIKKARVRAAQEKKDKFEKLRNMFGK